MADNSRSSVAVVNRPAVWLSGVLLVGAAGWNLLVGDWIDGLFLVGLGIGGALLLGAGKKEQADGSSPSALRWVGIVLLVTIFLVQFGMLLRYLLLR
jgi:hypothetical protein